MCQVCTEAVDCVALRIVQEKTQKRCPGFRAVGKNMKLLAQLSLSLSPSMMHSNGHYL